MTFNREAFDRGTAAAREMLIADEPNGHPYTEMCHGLAAVMVANDRPVDPMSLSARWHDPLCGATRRDIDDPSEMLRVLAVGGNYGFERIVKNSRASLEELLGSRYGADPLNRLRDKVRVREDAEAVERDARALFDLEYKMRWPDKRRGTKHYREAWERVADQARRIKLDERIAEAGRALLEAQHRVTKGDFAERLNKAGRIAAECETFVADLVALGVESRWIAELRTLAERARVGAVKMSESVSGELEELKRRMA